MTAATHTGLVRGGNEDCVRVATATGLAVVADGMGGHAGGAVASRTAVDALFSFLKNHDGNGNADDTLAGAFHHANRAVLEAASGDHFGMGTTLLAAVFGDDGVRVGHIGDCRLYRFAGGELAQLTADHNPPHAPHILQKAIGIDADCAPDVFAAPVAAGEVYLLCSDGLSGVVGDDEIKTILRDNTIDAADELITATLARGTPDNVSVVVVAVNEAE